MSRLRGIRESEKEVDSWNHTLPSLGQACQADRTHATEDSLSSLHLAECGDLRDSREWQQVPARCSRHISSVTTQPSQMLLYNRYEGLEVEPNNDQDHNPSRLEMLPRISRPVPHMKPTSIKKKR